MVKPYNIRAQWRLEWKMSNVIMVILPIAAVAAIMVWLIFYKKGRLRKLI
jgi:hypothetical protein